MVSRCANEIDDDGDGEIDWPADLGCLVDSASILASFGGRFEEVWGSPKRPEIGKFQGRFGPKTLVELSEHFSGTAQNARALVRVWGPSGPR